MKSFLDRIKVAVVGSRKVLDKSAVYAILTSVFDKYPDAIIVSGGADGPDTYAYQFCIDYGHDIIVCGAGWKRYGKSGGFIRNKRIVDWADIVIAFWDGISGGTVDTINKALDAGKIVFEYDFVLKKLIKVTKPKT